MKEFKNATLLKKTHISAVYIAQLCNFLTHTQGKPIQQELAQAISIIGYIAEGDCFLAKATEKCSSIFFVNWGTIIAYYEDHKKNISITAIYGPGQMALIPESVTSNPVSKTFLGALSGSHVLEIPLKEVQKNYKDYPSLERLTSLVLVQQCDKLMERERLSRYRGKARMLAFGKLFPHIRLQANNTSMMKYLVAAFLGITPQSLSRILRQMEQDENAA